MCDGRGPKAIQPFKGNWSKVTALQFLCFRHGDLLNKDSFHTTTNCALKTHFKSSKTFAFENKLEQYNKSPAIFTSIL